MRRLLDLMTFGFKFSMVPDEGGGGGSGGAGNPPGTPPAGTPPAATVVPKAEFDRVLNELHSHKARAKELEDAKKKSEDDNLKANQQWKELAERNEAKATEWQEKYNGLSQTVIKDKKITAVREEALKKGIRPEALQDLEMLEHKDVVVETTSTGRLNVLGATSAIDNLKTLRPHWFGGSAGPGVNTGTPGVNPPGGEVTLAQIKAAEIEMKKTGDSTAYNRLHQTYREQKKRA